MLIVLITIFAHYLPILIVLRIYTIEEKPQDITKSLIMDWGSFEQKYQMKKTKQDQKIKD